MKPLPKLENGPNLTPKRWDEISDRSSYASHAYVMAMLDITRDMIPADRDVFLHLGLISMIRRFEENGIYLDLSDLAEAAESIMDRDAFAQFAAAVDDAIERSNHAALSLVRMTKQLGIEKAEEAAARIRLRIKHNAARECMHIAETALKF